MSEQGTNAATANTNTPATAQTTAVAEKTEAAKAVEKLTSRFGKMGKLIARSNDTTAMTALSTLVDLLSVSRDEHGNAILGTDGKPIPNPKFFDWTEKAPAGFDNFALIRCEETDKDGDPAGDHYNDIRLIPIANWELAKEDAIVADWLNRAYQNKVALRADKDEAQEADFIVVGGAFKLGLSDDAFDAIQKPMLKMLHDQGLKGINKSGLKLAFGNSAFAASMFPRVKPEIWASLINMGKQFAAAKGLDTAIFDYWLQTRDAREDSSEDVEIDLTAFSKGLGLGETANTQAPAPTAPPAAPTA